MRTIFSLIFVIVFSAASAQVKTIADYTVEMTVHISDANGNMISQGNKVVSGSSKKVRTDYISAKIIQSTIRDNAANTAFILRETLGDNAKYLRKLNAEEWKKENQRFEGVKFQFLPDTQKVLNYDCKKAITQLKDGGSLTVWYTPGIAVLANENNYQFNSIPGLVLEYEIKNQERSMRFSATSVNFDPVPASKFIIPASGYRIID